MSGPSCRPWGQVSPRRAHRLGLYPSAKISSGFEPTTFALADGRVVTGIVRNETDGEVEIQDSDAKLIRLDKDQIDDRKRSDVSVMPTGLAPGL